MGEQIWNNRLLIKEETRMDMMYAFIRDFR
jgi:hypothetical protein